MYEIKYRKSDEMKDSSIEWIGDIPSEWNIMRLRYISSIDTGNKDTQDKIDDGLYPFYVRSDTIEKINTYSYEGEAILTAGDGVGVGKVFHYVKGKFAYHQRVYKLSNFRKIHGKYLYYYVSENFHKEVMKLSAKSTVDSLRRPMFSNFPVILPNFGVQKKIANFLDIKTAQFDSIISKKEQLIEKLEEAKKSLISEVVTGKVKIVERQLVKRDASEMKNSGDEWLGRIPSNWKIEKMKYIGSAIIGLTYSPDDVVGETGILVLRSSNVQNGSITFDNNVFVEKKINPKLGVRDGDILICSRNGSRKLIGKNALIRKEHEGATFGAFMTIFRTDYSKFIHMILNSSLFDYQAGSYLTSTVNQLTISNLNNMVIPFPPSTEQVEIHSYLGGEIELFTKFINMAQLQIDNLKKAKQSLISEAVTGKIDLRNWEIIEEGEL